MNFFGKYVCETAGFGEDSLLFIGNRKQYSKYMYQEYNQSRNIDFQNCRIPPAINGAECVRKKEIFQFNLIKLFFFLQNEKEQIYHNMV